MHAVTSRWPNVLVQFEDFKYVNHYYTLHCNALARISLVSLSHSHAPTLLDFSNKTAEPLLQKYRNKYLCFNDDIQGTGTVTLAGILCALRKKGLQFEDLAKQRIVCLGAGSAGLGVVNSLLYAMTESGVSHEEAVKNFWMVDHEGFLGAERESLYKSQRVFARTDLPNGLSLRVVVDHVCIHLPPTPHHQLTLSLSLSLSVAVSHSHCVIQ
jgi:hypothetical protein